MKKKFNMPVLSINKFDAEDIVTGSGTDNLSLMTDKMKEEGISVKSFSLKGVFDAVL